MSIQNKNDPYYVVSAETFEKLQSNVVRLALDGFSPLGGVTIAKENDKTLFCQAMWSDSRLRSKFIELIEFRRLRLERQGRLEKKGDPTLPPKET